MMRSVNVISRFRIAPVKALWVAVCILSRYEVFGLVRRTAFTRIGVVLVFHFYQKRSLYNIKFIVRIGLTEPVRIGNKR
jgi:hypothetical protein